MYEGARAYATCWRSVGVKPKRGGQRAVGYWEAVDTQTHIQTRTYLLIVSQIEYFISIPHTTFSFVDRMRGDTLVFLKLTRSPHPHNLESWYLAPFGHSQTLSFIPTEKLWKADLWIQKRSVASFSSLLFLLLTFSIFLFPALKTLSFLLPGTLHKTKESRVSSGRKLEWSKYPIQTRNLHDILFLHFGFERLSYFYFLISETRLLHR